MFNMLHIEYVCTRSDHFRFQDINMLEVQSGNRMQSPRKWLVSSQELQH